MKNHYSLLLLCFILNACKTPPSGEKYKTTDAEYMHQCEKKLTDIIVTDIFTPPVASRIYAYPSLAAYEVMRLADTSMEAIAPKLKGFEPMPIAEKNKTYDYTIAGIKAFCSTAKKVIFSVKEIDALESQLLNKLKIRCANEEEYNRSIDFGQKTADIIIKRLQSDQYKETRGMQRFEVRAAKGRWLPTLPDYADAIEPNWMKMKPMLMDSAAACKPPNPIPYSENKQSAYWKELIEVYESVNNMNTERDEIVRFWDDNPFVSRSKGHSMFQEKKMTPGGHWMAICRIVTRYKKVNLPETARAYALTSLVLYDAFISCWDEKYRSAKVRPETIIKDKINKDWQPYLITPPFPAYTSGHSTISAAAAEILTSIYGDNVAFVDTTQKEYDLPVRSFKSFRQAALEASQSRVYAGIHYQSDCSEGNKQGIRVGELLISKIHKKNTY